MKYPIPNIQYPIKKHRGFTLIEMMISVALFSVIMVIGVGTVLSANNAHKKTQNVRAILDNLSFVMEDMSRNLRTGTNYHCDGGSIMDPLDGNFCNSIAFISVADPVNQWQYLIGQDRTQSTVKFRVYKNITTINSNYMPITPLDIDIDPYRSGFTIIGSCSVNLNNLQRCLGDKIQPKVIIRLSGSITYQNTVTPFDLQTTVSQRMYDN